MRTSRAIRWPGWALAFACTFALAILGVSCRSVLGVEEGYQDSIDVVCGFLDRCYSSTYQDCRKRFLDKLDVPESDNWSLWLANVGTHQCLEACGSARRCLDEAPLCGNEACISKEDCCGFVGGRIDCDSKRGVCCKLEGNSCANDDECCTGMGPCSLLTSTCGGVFCAEVGDPCVNSFECCSKVCRDSKCAKDICGANGFECEADADCCGGFCDAQAKRCGVPICGVLGFPCEGEADCCDSLYCHVPDGAAIGVCSDCPTGLPNDTDCGKDSDCCTKHCDTNFFQCGDVCQEEGSACEESSECCDGVCTKDVCHVECPTSCTGPEDCCTKECIGGQCKPQCAEATCAHDACQVGLPLSMTCTGCDTPNCKLTSACVTAVCTEDKYCCCSQWDSLCVLEASQMVECDMSCKKN